ncbi:hypothetical protein B9Z55_013259 [Caenorhabditis nigoni]|uniref:Uncharacterized protein n=1 Tax=Caenorhabditis nigoni TaxID=1611254 RepID=A0A2G5U0W3_9PELO|nr:hypothetical protein B9Z55_013259 [Caenorhabditis nigoni]
MSQFFLDRISEQGITSLLIVTVHLASSSEGHFKFDMMSQVCTFFILIVMFISVTITIVCYVSIRKQMKIRSSDIGTATHNTQEQLNAVLLIQFLFPFLTIHIPFYITFMIPFFNRDIDFLTDNMLYLCAWCPAINPIIVMVMVKVIKYFTFTKTLYIIKNGFALPVYIGQAFLIIFIVSIVMFCNGPVVQYLQVKTILKATSKQDANFAIFLIPISIGIPALALVFFGYISKSEIFPQEMVNMMKNQGMATTLTIPMTLEMANLMPLICTSFILFVMLVSIIFAISCFVRIKILMKQKFAASTSSSSKKSQDQLNTMLLIQFIFPFFTIHTPILITFVLPFFDMNLELLSDNMLYLSAWCPAANPIIVMSVVKTIMYLNEVKSLYIVKGGIDLPTDMGCILLNLFLVFVVTSCTGPAVQYLQVTYLLSSPVLKNHSVLRALITLIPLFVAIPTSILIFNGYMPNKYEKGISKDLIQEITGEHDNAFLIASEEKIYDESSGTFEYDIPARICTGFIFFAMFSSLIVVIVCFIKMQVSKKKKTSISNQKSKKQLNLLLFVQFIFPFITIHIPFYVAFILPFADIEFDTLSSKLPYMFAWCPAINPILVICMIKTVMYLDETKALYIAKGGFDLPIDIGCILLILFLVFVVTSCTGPAVQYLQVAHLLCSPMQKTHSVLRTMITLIPLFVAIPTVILVFNGYVPNEYEKEISKEMILVITGKNDTSFLMAAEEKIYDFSSGTFEYDIPARICTGFIFSAMFLSLIVVIVCFIRMQITMKKKTSISNQKSQKQLNLLLFVQFIFPFITIHIPFYVAFILPFVDIEFSNLSSKLPYMFAWCPAINPILVICMIKSICDKLLNRKGTPVTGTTLTTSTHIFHVRTNSFHVRTNSHEINRIKI